MKLTIIRGIPGSGKSTYARKHYQCCILENDQFQIVNGEYKWSPDGTQKAISTVISLTKQILASGADVCIANTFTKKKFVDSYKAIARLYGADFEVIRCTGNFNNVHNVPKYILENMKNNFEDYPEEIFV